MLFRIGQGFDIHNISFYDDVLEEVKHPLIIGGVVVAKNIEVSAHSDGDVLYHALIDAILGALGKEDIGDLFPPDKEEYRNISSQILLLKVLEQTQYKEEWQFVNIDINIILQKPKLKEYKSIIKKQLLQILNITADKVSIKAKTFENEQSNQIWSYCNILIEKNTTL